MKFITDGINEAVINLDHVQSFYYSFLDNKGVQLPYVIRFQMRDGFQQYWQYEKESHFKGSKFQLILATLGAVEAALYLEADKKAEKEKKEVKNDV